MTRIALIAAVLTLALPATASARTLTFILAGQSNMAGHGANPDAVGDPRVQVLGVDGAWGASVEPFPNGQGAGPGLSFGMKVATDANVDVRLIPCAIPGSPVTDWAAGGALYNACLALAGSSQVDGILYFQGEAETNDAAMAAGWSAGFLSFVDGMRGRYPAVPIVYAQLGVYTWPFWDVVKAAQASVQAARSNMAMIRTDDLPTDAAHFPTASYRVIGERFASAWEALTPVAPPPVVVPPAPPVPPAPAPPAAPPASSGPPPATPVVAPPVVAPAPVTVPLPAVLAPVVEPAWLVALAERSEALNVVYGLA